MNASNQHEGEALDRLVNAAGAFLALAAEAAKAEDPQLAAQADAALREGSAHTRLVIELAGTAVQVTAQLVSPANGRPLMRLAFVEGVMRTAH